MDIPKSHYSSTSLRNGAARFVDTQNITESTPDVCKSKYQANPLDAATETSSNVARRTVMFKRLIIVLLAWPLELLTNGPKNLWKNCVTYIRTGK